MVILSSHVLVTTCHDHTDAFFADTARSLAAEPYLMPFYSHPETLDKPRIPALFSSLVNFSRLAGSLRAGLSITERSHSHGDRK
jgi:hypothetical protein